MRISCHEFPHGGGACVHCGGKSPSQLCIHRTVADAPRGIPPSIFAGDINGIGDRGREIAADEWKAVSESKPE